MSIAAEPVIPTPTRIAAMANAEQLRKQVLSKRAKKEEQLVKLDNAGFCSSAYLCRSSTQDTVACGGRAFGTL